MFGYNQIYRHIYEHAHNRAYNKTCVTSKDSNTPVHPPIMARVLVYPSLDSLKAVKAHPNSVDPYQTAQTNLSLRWSHKFYCRFCRALAQLLHFGKFVWLQPHITILYNNLQPRYNAAGSTEWILRFNQSNHQNLHLREIDWFSGETTLSQLVLYQSTVSGKNWLLEGPKSFLVAQTLFSRDLVCMKANMKLQMANTLPVIPSPLNIILSLVTYIFLFLTLRISDWRYGLQMWMEEINKKKKKKKKKYLKCY